MKQRVLFFYASQTGNARGLAKEWADMAVERGYDARSLGMEAYKTVTFEEEPVIIVVASSTGNGDCPDNGDKFFRQCKRKTTSQFLTSSRFAVCALGDSNYDAFCAVGKEFDKHFERLGGQRLLKRCDVDEVEGLETFIDPWLETLWKELAKITSAADSSVPAAARRDDAASDQSPPAQPVGGEAAAPIAVQEGATGIEADTDADDVIGRSASQPLRAPIVAARWLTAAPPGAQAVGAEGARRVLHVEVDVRAGGEAMRFEPGDALGVLPTNEPDAVDAVIQALGLGAAADGPVPAAAGGLPAHLQRCASVRAALSNCVDIGSVSVWPPLPLLKLLHSAPAAPARTPNAPLVDLVQRAVKGGTEGRKAHGTLQRQRASLCELLVGLGCRPPLGTLLDTLPPLSPRYYSIASAPAADQGRMHLCLSVVEYSTKGVDGQVVARRGVASNMIARQCEPLLAAKLPSAVGTDAKANGRQPNGSSNGSASGAVQGPSLLVFRREASGHELRLPSDPAAPIVMVGPGTGLAPFRGFLQQRRYGWARKQLGPCHLFFGCRARDVDFLYGDELGAMAATGALTLHTAFSREGEPTTAGAWRGARIGVDYVQDLIETNASVVAELLFQRRGRLYVCGDGQAMASDVHAALVRVTASELHLSTDEAEAKLAALVADGRYSREIWN